MGAMSFVKTGSPGAGTDCACAAAGAKTPTRTAASQAKRLLSFIEHLTRGIRRKPNFRFLTSIFQFRPARAPVGQRPGSGRVFLIRKNETTVRLAFAFRSTGQPHGLFRAMFLMHLRGLPLGTDIA